jgi:hypothetical protein
MRKGLELLGNAEDCRKLAKRTKDPQHKKQLEDMAQTWERLAAERATRLARKAKRGALAKSRLT